MKQTIMTIATLTVIVTSCGPSQQESEAAGRQQLLNQQALEKSTADGLANQAAQQVPVFKGTTYENNGAMGDDQIDTWNYKGYIFKTITPGIARPIITTSVFKQRNGELSEIKNHELFVNNVSKITEIVNSKLKSEYISQQKEDPKCYKEFHPLGINELSISVDENYMYFEITWDSSYLTDANSDECIYTSTVAKINLTEISNLIISN